MITALRFRNAVLSGANNLFRNKEEIDKLNVFPVPDGDTGTNMSMTLAAGVAALEAMPIDKHSRIDEVSRDLAAAILRGARGNSGVIVSLLFQGFADGCVGKRHLSWREFTAALMKGVDQAYKAVLKPTEGTILTVSRMAASGADKAAKEGGKEKEVLGAVWREGEEALSKTPEMLPLLKKAGVVDAGGQGYIAFFEGVMHYLRTGKIITVEKSISFEESIVDPVPISEDEITYTYCTEMLLQKEDNADPEMLRQELDALGDSLIVVAAGDLIKVHVHTDHPGMALESALRFGSFEKTKIENMRLQFRARQGEKQEEKKENESVAPTEEIGLVAVCAGSGLATAFVDLGCHRIIQGGQTMNPSAEDILSACLLTPAKVVFVLPNNSNIVMAAQQAAGLATDREIRVIPTKTIPQGIAAALIFGNTEGDADQFEEAMKEAVSRVRSAQITYAARDSELDDLIIKEGEVLALSEGKLISVHQTLKDAALRLIDELCDNDSAFLTLFCGEGSNDAEAEEILARASQQYPQLECSRIDGGQPVYPYLISVEF